MTISKNTIAVLLIIQILIFSVNIFVAVFFIEPPITGKAIGIVKLEVIGTPSITPVPELPTPTSCVPQWDCTDWSECIPEGKQYRDCSNTNNCYLTYNKPAEEQDCIYIPTCEDNIQNQDEVDVDCGGPCPSCTPIVVERPETIMSPIAEFLFLAGTMSLAAITITIIILAAVIALAIIKGKNIKKWLKKIKIL